MYRFFKVQVINGAIKLCRKLVVRSTDVQPNLLCGFYELIRVSLSCIVVNVAFEGRFTPFESALCGDIPSEVIVPVVPSSMVIMPVSSTIYEPPSPGLGSHATQCWWRGTVFIVHELFLIYVVTTK